MPAPDSSSDRLSTIEPKKTVTTPDNTVNPISKKISKILESKVETDKDLLDALQTISTFFDENSLKSRRNLRRDTERRSLAINREFLENFRSVKQELDKVAENVTAMSRFCAAMTERLETTKNKTRDLLNKTTQLQAESKRVEKQAEIANAFLAQFFLQPSEIKALKGTPEGGISKDFFSALARTKEIHSGCKNLLLTEQHTAGLEIMDKMASFQEQAYELLYRWVQREFRLLNVEAFEISPLICDAIVALQNRPVLLKYSFDEFCTARRTYIVKAFIDALTKGGSGGVPKPIELLSHDPMRYIGDILGWIHQSFESEKELTFSLLKQCSEEVVKENLPLILSQTTEGLCRPFKVRVEQVLGGEHGPVVLYKLSNLFRFYCSKIKPHVVENSPFLYSLNELRELLSSMFFSSLNSRVHHLLEKAEPPGPDLLPISALHQVLLLLRDVLESHDTTVVASDDKKESFEKIFAAVVDPSLQTLILTSTHLNQIDVAVYSINCIHAVYSLLSLYQYTEKRLEMLQAQMDVNVDVLVSEQAGYILNRVGMMRVYEAASSHQISQGPLSKLVGMDSATVKSALEKFDLFLASPDSYKLPQCRATISPKMRAIINQRTIETVCNAYGIIYEKIMDERNKYENPSTIVDKSFEQVRQLLS